MKKRVNWKLPFINKLFLSNSFLRANSYKTNIRNSMLSPLFINKNLKIHAGNYYGKINVRQDMVWHKMGEFAFTKKMGYRKKKSKAGKNKKRR